MVIQQTPILEGEDANRFIQILNDVDNTILNDNEKEIKDMVNNLPENLKI